MPEDQVPNDEFIRKLEEYEEVKSKLEEYEVVKRAWRRAVRRLNEEYESRGKSPLADLEDERQLYQLAQTWTSSTYVGDIPQHEFALVARTYLLTVDWLLEHLEDLRQHFQGISGEEGEGPPSR
jgi:hypothetical protein